MAKILVRTENNMTNQIVCGLLVLTSLFLLVIIGRLDLLLIVLPLSLLLTLAIAWSGRRENRLTRGGKKG
jgi:hypothetical protein